jgi:hypothetical protein
MKWISKLGFWILLAWYFKLDIFPSLKQTWYFKLENGKNQVQHSILRLDATTKKGTIVNFSNSKNLASNKQLLL